MSLKYCSVSRKRKSYLSKSGCAEEGTNTQENESFFHNSNMAERYLIYLQVGTLQN